MRANGRSRVRPITIADTAAAAGVVEQRPTTIGPRSSRSRPRAGAPARTRGRPRCGASAPTPGVDELPRSTARRGARPACAPPAPGTRCSRCRRWPPARGGGSAPAAARGLRSRRSASTRSASCCIASSRSAARLEARRTIAAPNRQVGHVDLALLQALDQLARRQVDQHDVAQRGRRRVRHGLAHAHAGDPVDHVVEALQVLDVDRGVDVDAGVQQLHHVLPAALVAAARRRCVREFVDQRDLGLRASSASRSSSSSVRPRYSTRRAAALRALEQRLRLARPCVSTMPTTTSTPRRFSSRAARQHRVGLADAGRGAEEDLSRPPPWRCSSPSRASAWALR
jgi:hypothetical protein